MHEIKRYDSATDGDVKQFAGRMSAPYMPEAPDAKATRYVACGPVTFGVEFRVVGYEKGVSLHVFGNDGGRLTEYLRFDCLDERPHYHYVCHEKGYQDRFFIDTAAEGDPVAWSLERLRTRLPLMLARAGAAPATRQIDPEALEKAAGEVAQATYEAILRCN